MYSLKNQLLLSATSLIITLLLFNLIQFSNAYDDVLYYVPKNISKSSPTLSPNIIGAVPLSDTYYSPDSTCKINVNLRIEKIAQPVLLTSINPDVILAPVVASSIFLFIFEVGISPTSTSVSLLLQNTFTHHNTTIYDFANVFCFETPKNIIVLKNLLKLVQNTPSLIQTSIQLAPGSDRLDYKCSSDCLSCVATMSSDNILVLSLSMVLNSNCSLPPLAHTKILLEDSTYSNIIQFTYPLLFDTNINGVSDLLEEIKFYPLNSQIIANPHTDYSGGGGKTSNQEIYVYGEANFKSFNSLIDINSLAYKKFSYRAFTNSLNVSRYIIKFERFAPNPTGAPENFSTYFALFNSNSSTIQSPTKQFQLSSALPQIPLNIKQNYKDEFGNETIYSIQSTGNSYLTDRYFYLQYGGKKLYYFPEYYGMTKVNIQNYEFEISEVNAAMFGGKDIQLVYKWYNSVDIPVPGNGITSNVPTVNGLEIVNINGEYFIHIKINSGDSHRGGIRYYKYPDIESYQQTYPYLVGGSLVDGEFLIPYDVNKKSIELINTGFFTLNLVLDNPYFLDSNGYYFPGPHRYCKLVLEEFLEFKFSKTIIDLNNKEERDLNLQFNLTNADTSFQPILMIQPYQLDGTIEFKGYWRPDLMMYYIPFSLQKNLNPGDLSYTFKNMFYDSNRMFLSLQFRIMFGDEKAQLQIKSSTPDLSPPIITEIAPILVQTPSPNIPFGIGWDLRVEDPINGLKEITITVTGDLDKSPYVFTLRPENKTSGDQFNGVYSIRFDHEFQTPEQTYTIVSATSIDTAGVKGNFYTINPLYRFLNSSLLTLVTPRTTSDQLDISSPVLESMTVVELVPYKEYQVNFTVFDESGISPRHFPIVYISSQLTQPIGFKSNLISRNDTNAEFSSIVRVPKNFGNQCMLISIYGIFDTYFNLAGYNWNQILKMNTITNPRRDLFPDYTPTLTHHSPISKLGGRITIYGSFLSTSLKGYLITPTNVQEISTISFSDPSYYFVFDLPPNDDPTINRVSIFVNSTTTISNVLDINFITIQSHTPSPTTSTPSPTPTQTQTVSPTPSPSVPLCKGTPLCSGHGQSIITVISLREIGKPKPDGSYEIINDHKLTNWSLVNLTTSDGSQMQYQYSTRLDNSKNTSIIVTTTFFKSETKIGFAGTEFTVLVDSNNNNESSSKCTKRSGKFTNSQLAGIVVGSVVGFLLVVLLSVYIIRKKYKIIIKSRNIKLVTMN
eukprot:gene9720-11936_t